METTNNVFDTSLYAVLSPSTLLTWVRSIVSNRMAASGADWVRLFAMYNSGTVRCYILTCCSRHTNRFGCLFRTVQQPVDCDRL